MLACDWCGEDINESSDEIETLSVMELDFSFHPACWEEFKKSLLGPEDLRQIDNWDRLIGLKKSPNNSYDIMMED